jgi:dihydropyrimidine dehydrogenase (NAD+) subunit PreA
LVGKALPYVTRHECLSRTCKPVAAIDQSVCLKDGICFIACRDGGHQAIEIGEERAPRVNEEKCVGCGLCLTVCPVKDCIQIKERK